MQMTVFARCALIIGAAALFAGCAGSQLPTGAPGVIPQSRSTLSTESGADRVFAASSYSVLYRFRHRGYRGSDPDGSLIDINGTLYGTTWGGGGANLGAVFSVTTDGDEKVLYGFTGHDDGEDPVALTVVNGTIYGVDYNYGEYDGGVFFKLDQSGYLTTLHAFGNSGDGVSPNGLIDVKGRLYGTTSLGGDVPCYEFGCGTVYSVTTSGVEKVLYSFGLSSDGEYPHGNLIDVNGTLYGTTTSGGSSGNGTVFAITTLGKERIVYSFLGGSDGAAPEAGLFSIKGTLYGTTSAGGGSGCGGRGCGTVYAIGASGFESVLHRFSGVGDGAVPMAPLVAVNGRLYGTTSAGGGSGCDDNGCGTVYSISTAGAESVLHGYGEGGLAGRNPMGGLIDVGGTLYGTTSAGGSEKGRGVGTVFSISR
jgi:uncharacterized repeat protein (TIGR03803 family)